MNCVKRFVKSYGQFYKGQNITLSWILKIKHFLYNFQALKLFQDFDKRKISMYHISPKLIKNPQQKYLKTNKVFSYYNWPVTSPKFPLWKTLTLSMVLSKNISYHPMPCSSQHQHLDLIFTVILSVTLIPFSF